MILNNKTLKSLNSFAIDVSADQIIAVYTKSDLLQLWQQAVKNAIPVLILGGGSNVLFLENFAGTILLNRITGLVIKENHYTWDIHVGAGEIWHNLVHTCLTKHIPGLENLALIPGYVGSAPIQNIGAYGVELCQFCVYVDVLQLETGILHRLSTVECDFSYRDSIFKHALRENHVIIAVGLRLSKIWQPILTYGELTHLNPQQTTPIQIYNTVCAIRHTKLPNPMIQGNAGSFFKNPIVNSYDAKKIIKRFPDIPYYTKSNGKIKFIAAWCIEHCGLKGYRLGNAAVHDKQALVLVNINNATGYCIVKLASYVRQRVADQFSIWLEPEVRFIGAFGEVDAIRIMTDNKQEL